MKYFEVNLFPIVPESWILGMVWDPSGLQSDVNMMFTSAKVNVSRAAIPIQQAGAPQDWTIAPIGLPVLSAKCAKIVTEIVPADDIQIIPVDIDGFEDHFALRVLLSIDCINREASNITYYPEGYPLKERIGLPQYILKLRIDPNKTAGRHLFRVMHQAASIVLSETLLRAMLDSNITGLQVSEV